MQLFAIVGKTKIQVFFFTNTRLKLRIPAIGRSNRSTFTFFPLLLVVAERTRFTTTNRDCAATHLFRHMSYSRMIITLLLPVVGLTSSCANLKPTTINNQIRIESAREIEGRYSNVALNHPEYRYHDLKALIDHTNQIETNDSIVSVGVKVLNGKELQFEFTGQNQSNYRYTSNYELKDGRIILRNRSFRLTGIPYLLGGYQYNKTELSLTNDKSLLVRSLQKEDGAFLIIIPASLPRSNFENIFIRN